MLTTLALTAVLPAAHAQALTGTTVVDYSDNFDGYTNTNTFSVTGGWTTQYSTDRWSKLTVLTTGVLRSNSDNASGGAGWGVNGAQDNALVQMGNTCGPPASRTRACSWGTYQVDFDYLTPALTTNPQDDALGAVFSWQDNNDFWVLAITRDAAPNQNGTDGTPGNTSRTRLIHVQNGVGTEMFSGNFQYTHNAIQHVTVVVESGTIQVFTDADGPGPGAAVRIINATPSTGTGTGRAGLYAYDNGGNNATVFDNFAVRIQDTDKDTVGNPYDNCPNTANTTQADLDADGLGDACDTDQDGDGVEGSNGDCDDRDKARFPGNPEICDGIDQDCDGIIDDNATGATWYADTDKDGFGDPAATKSSCTQPAGYVANANDCNDTNAAITDGTLYYADTDADGFGDKTTGAKACTQPVGRVADATDCNDASKAVNPSATETCDNVDQDCDGVIDDNATDATTWYTDADKDTFGDTSTATKACAAPAGAVATSGDCNDKDATAFPGGTEVCDLVDDDCDGAVDDNATDAKTWYTDGDGDLHGDATSSTKACAAPAGTVALGDDCLDTDKTAYPGASETCDGVDDDCDGTTDDNATDAPLWYADADDDTYGDPATGAKSCAQLVDTVADNKDCDDTRDTVNPAGTEACNGLDDDCDGTIDDGATDVQTWYADTDKDGYGDKTTSTTSCTPPAGYVADGTDCDDKDKNESPGEPEVCDGADQNCDGLVDNNATDATEYFVDSDKDGLGDDASKQLSCNVVPGLSTVGGDCDDTDATVLGPDTWYADADNDGHGDLAVTADACAQPTGYVASDDDCDDADRNVSPDADEQCITAGVDDDCDGSTDEADAIDVPTWYTDGDIDGFGTGTGTQQCTAPAGGTLFDGDCDDADPLYHPGATETCVDEVDYNCDGSIGQEDADKDGTVACLDCDDTNADAHPGGTEVCDGADNDCDGTFDGVDAADAAVWYQDLDGDGHGDILFGTKACTQPADHTTTSDDCNDGAADVYPGAPEQCTDTSDKNCDGVVGNVDTDNDGFSACEECDDTDGDVNPDAEETCNGIDDNCAGGIDEGGETWYADADADGFGDDATAEDTCFPDAGAVDEGGDCDDADPDRNPDATDIPDDGIDQDCDGEDATEIVDTDTGEDTDTSDTSDVDEIAGRYQGGCNCDAAPSVLSVAWLGLVGLVIRRRRADRA